MAGSGRERVSERVSRLNLPFEASGYDAYGTSRKGLERVFSLLKPIYRGYFRVRCHGMEHIPRGRAMLVPNHAGGIGLDATMLIGACFFDLEPPRLAQGMADRFLNRLPLASLITNRMGQLTGLPEHAARLLQEERLLLVFPEGVRGTAKLFSERRTLHDFPSGFVRLALKTKTPIVPVGILGAGEALPTLVNLQRIGGWLGLPYLPLTPYLLPLPLPARFELFFGEPLLFEGTDDEDESSVQRCKAEVRSAIERLVAEGAAKYRVFR